jgi:hypothetical protein
MHETLSPSFKGFVDTFSLTDGNLRFTGWLITNEPSRDNVVYYVEFGHSIAFYNYNERPDVAEFYNTTDTNYIRSGFDINIPAGPGDVIVYATINGRRENIFKLNTQQNYKALVVESSLVEETVNVQIRNNVFPSVVVVDNFYTNPHELRQLALEQEFIPDIRYHKGKRTSKKFLAQNTKQMFESLLGKRITRWQEFDYNGVFQHCTAEDPLVYHSDVQSYAAAVYLTPGAPVTCGTSFYRSRKHKDVYKTHVDGENYNEIFQGGYYDRTNFELVDTVGNVFNRLVMWDARLIHSASEYFGTDKYNSRLFHLFFFDIEE